MKTPPTFEVRTVYDRRRRSTHFYIEQYDDLLVMCTITHALAHTYTHAVILLHINFYGLFFCSVGEPLNKSHNAIEVYLHCLPFIFLCRINVYVFHVEFYIHYIIFAYCFIYIFIF